MSDVQADAGSIEEPPKKKSKAMLFGLVGAVLLGGGAFFGVYSGMIPLPFGGAPENSGEEVPSSAKNEQSDGEVVGTDHPGNMSPVSFVALDEMIISLGPDARSRHLKLVLSVEVAPENEAAVTAVKPRIMDVLNTFLRAVDERDIESPRAMGRLRAQMLRRIQLVTPEHTVRDLLVQQFILN